MREANSVKEFLETALEAKLEFARLERRVESLSARSLQYPMSSESAHVRELHHILACEVTRELANMQRCADQVDAVDALIEQISDAAYRNLLRYRYFHDCTFLQMQMRLMSDLNLNYSERQIHRLFDAALGEAQKLWEFLYNSGESKTAGEKTRKLKVKVK